MKPTDVKDPNYYHKVVDCQWACPAHTPVPDYIRLIAKGRYSDAYMVNRESNVFPGILGRICDRPCEPACRRQRVEDEPVAICRLKRVAADLKDDISDRLPKAPAKKNGKKIALVGAGPASLTVANDLLPLGYEVTIFEKLGEPGGLMRSNVPRFRLPLSVLSEEINSILNMGAVVKYNTPVDSMKQLLTENFDAVFVGSGAPKGKDLKVPGREEAAEFIHIGIEWLESVAFQHIESIEENVVVIGAGNTAMDCCRTARRLGGVNTKVFARSPKNMLKASPWELEDAEEEKIEIIVNHSPHSFVVENGKLTAVKFEKLEYSKDENGRSVAKVIDLVTFPADRVILAIGQDNSFPWIERDIGIDFNKWDMPEVDETTFQCSRTGVFFGGDAAWGAKNIIWAVAHGHQAALSIDLHCHGKSLTEGRPSETLNLLPKKMGMHQWAYDNDFDNSARSKMVHLDLVERLDHLEKEVELGFNAEQITKEVQRCLNCDVQTVFEDAKCIECDACIDVCPVDCLTIAENSSDSKLELKLLRPVLEADQNFFASGALPQTGRAMFKDENHCIHCGLCAERCPTSAWDMQKSVIGLPRAGQ